MVTAKTQPLLSNMGKSIKEDFKEFPRLELSSNLILPCTYPFLKINIVSSYECPLVLFIYEKPSEFLSLLINYIKACALILIFRG